MGLLGLLGLGTLVGTAGAAPPRGPGGSPLYRWVEDVDAQGHDLANVGALVDVGSIVGAGSVSMADNPTAITDFAGANLSVGAGGVLNAADTDTRTDVSDDGGNVVSDASVINFGTDLTVTDDGDGAVTVDASGSSPWSDADDDGHLDAPGYAGIDVGVVGTNWLEAESALISLQINGRVQAGGFPSLQAALEEAYFTRMGSVIDIPPGVYGPVTPFPGQTLVGSGRDTVIEAAAGSSGPAIDLRQAEAIVGEHADDVTLTRLAVRGGVKDEALRVGPDQRGLVMTGCRVVDAGGGGINCDGTACVFTGNVFSGSGGLYGIRFGRDARDCVATGNADVGRAIDRGSGSVIANNS